MDTSKRYTRVVGTFQQGNHGINTIKMKNYATGEKRYAPSIGRKTLSKMFKTKRSAVAYAMLVMNRYARLLQAKEYMESVKYHKEHQEEENAL